MSVVITRGMDGDDEDDGDDGEEDDVAGDDDGDDCACDVDDDDEDDGAGDNPWHKRGLRRPKLLHWDPPDQSVTFLLACRIDNDRDDDDIHNQAFNI